MSKLLVGVQILCLKRPDRSSMPSIAGINFEETVLGSYFSQLFMVVFFLLKLFGKMLVASMQGRLVNCSLVLGSII
ncbi:hypothetical protein ERO13_D08G183650v2 [Gossypium hirsutum]|uniref:Uncharacterized protein n=3 Tax=Gossypium TaxID=3633 RepID=A0A5J5QGK2_GOSBA|nr:hypothetical protein ES319_D08G200100v1 [Gossypium barbadense]KAG4134892.1 hypothetical protein ERO13_D08G183650v2 [Gossypium hirsutum]TYH59210.1 hypothetical protein ES332_D08G208100v1 [Gossypium tomentosum]TYI70151.1 hypothetical protein E1A91_D08G201800v1 [Gossypium mustelinum]